MPGKPFKTTSKQYEMMFWGSEMDFGGTNGGKLSIIGEISRSRLYKEGRKVKYYCIYWGEKYNTPGSRQKDPWSWENELSCADNWSPKNAKILPEAYNTGITKKVAQSRITYKVSEPFANALSAFLPARWAVEATIRRLTPIVSAASRTNWPPHNSSNVIQNFYPS